MTYGILVVFYAVCFLPIVVIFAVLPYIGRKTLSFGVSIPSAEFMDDELRHLRKIYAAAVSAAGGAFTAAYIVLLSFVSAEAAVYFMTAILLVYLVVVSAMYVSMWRRVKEIKARKGWEAHEMVAADTGFAKKRRAVSPAWFIVYALIILATAAAGLLLYGDMPEQIVQKYDVQGNAVKMADKSIGLIFFAPVTQAIMSLVFAFAYWMMLRTPPVLDPDNPEATSRQNTVFRYRWSAYIVFGGIVMLLVFLVAQLGITGVIGVETQLWAPIIGAGSLVIGALALGIATGQSGSRVKAGRSVSGGEIRRDDDRYWKWGVIYVNKDDPALFVEKRFGIGFTVNFGRPAAMLVTAGLLLLIVASIVTSALLVE